MLLLLDIDTKFRRPGNGTHRLRIDSYLIKSMVGMYFMAN